MNDENQQQIVPRDSTQPETKGVNGSETAHFLIKNDQNVLRIRPNLMDSENMVNVKKILLEPNNGQNIVAPNRHEWQIVPYQRNGHKMNENVGQIIPKQSPKINPLHPLLQDSRLLSV